MKPFYFDGAFGTYYNEMFTSGEPCELANLRYQKRVSQIHKAYIDAGVNAIKTNTFGANHTLSQEESVICDILTQGYKIACEAVRGTDVLNDATLVDAKQVKMDEIAPVMGNGSGVAGTCLNKISSAALGKIENADVIIAKGQGNFETLRLCGKNIYYIFMCKCNFFAERFGVPQYSGMLVNDLRLE